MKKFNSILAIVAIALTAVFAFTSCDKNEEPADDKDKKPTEIAKFARYTAVFSEDIFEYGTFTIEVECDGAKISYEVSEKYKTTGSYFNGFAPGLETSAYRKFDLPAFIYDNDATFAAKFTLSEAGKQKIAENGDKLIFVGYATELACAHTDANDQLDHYVRAESYGSEVAIKKLKDGFGDPSHADVFIRKTFPIN